MLITSDILDEKNPIIRKENEEVSFPMEQKDLDMIEKMLDHLYKSQIEEYAKKYNLRPGMGLAAPQVGINKRYFVVCHEEDENKFHNYVIINPEIISHSEELIYAEEGEGCLSVNREVDGIVPRYARVTVKGKDTNGKDIKIRAREELAIAFQHEIDHLNGILFVDRIDKNNPFKNADYMRPI